MTASRIQGLPLLAEVGGAWLARMPHLFVTQSEDWSMKVDDADSRETEQARSTKKGVGLNLLISKRPMSQSLVYQARV
jgi:hypothetical protein